MLPTFDFSNLVRKIVVIGNFALLNPLAFAIEFAIAMGVLFVTLLSKFDLVSFTAPLVDFQSFFNLQGDFGQLVLFLLSPDVLCSIVNTVFSFFKVFVPFSLVFLISYFAMAWALRSKQLLRATILTAAGQNS